MQVGTWVALGLAVAAAAALVAWQGGTADGDAGAYMLTVSGPEGVLFNGSIRVEHGTPLALLEAAAAARGFAIETDSYPQFGCGVYVRSVAGHEARGTEGWVYEVERDGHRVRPPMAACAYGLQQGDVVYWLWGSP